MPKLTRTLTYEGPERWLQMCVDNAFVALKQELGGDKSITSRWEDPNMQERAEMATDEERRNLYLSTLSTRELTVPVDLTEDELIKLELIFATIVEASGYSNQEAQQTLLRIRKALKTL